MINELCNLNVGIDFFGFDYDWHYASVIRDGRLVYNYMRAYKNT